MTSEGNVMSDNTKENINNLFSEYGLDERQKLLSMELGFKSFKLLYYIAAILTGVWLFIYMCVSEAVPFVFVAVSYLIAAMVCMSVYAVRASKRGLINEPTSFYYTRNGLIAAMFYAFVALMYGFCLTDNNSHEFVSFAAALGSIQHFVFYLCGRRNFKVLEEQAREDD